MHTGGLKTQDKHSRMQQNDRCCHGCGCSWVPRDKYKVLEHRAAAEP